MDDDEQLLDLAADRAFARLEEVGRDVRLLPVLHRTIAVVHAAQGVLDNGGLRYFFECDWPGQPPYAAFVEVYRAIGAEPEAEALDEAARAFGLSEPEREPNQRLELLAGPLGDRLEALDARMTSDVWRLLAAFVHAHREELLADG